MGKKKTRAYVLRSAFLIVRGVARNSGFAVLFQCFAGITVDPDEANDFLQYFPEVGVDSSFSVIYTPNSPLFWG